MVTAQLTGVDQRHTRNDIAECSKQLRCVTHTFKLGTIPTVLIMVGDEVHTDGFGTDGGIGLGEIRPEVLDVALTLCYLIHDVVQRPAVVHVESRFGQLVRFVLILCEGEHLRVGLAEIGHCPVPEISRHLSCYVATETVDADAVHPEMHSLQHGIAHVLVLVVEFGDIGPVVLHHQVTQTVAIVPAFVLGPLAVRCGMVSHPVEDDLKAHLVCGSKEMFEVRARAELGIDGAVVDDGVVTAERAFTGDHTDRLARHDPDDVDAVVFEHRQQRLCGSKRTFRRRLSGVEFIDRCVVRKSRVT